MRIELQIISLFWMMQNIRFLMSVKPEGQFLTIYIYEHDTFHASWSCALKIFCWCCHALAHTVKTVNLSV